MFYLADGHIYLGEKDSNSDKYPEVRLIVVDFDANDQPQFGLELTGGGVAEKPKNRSVCDMTGLVAKLGAIAVEQFKAEAEAEAEE